MEITFEKREKKLFEQMIFLLAQINDKLDKLSNIAIPKPTAVGISFYTTMDGFVRKVDKMDLKLTQDLQLSIQIKDAAGNPAQVDGAPTWSLSDPSLGTLAPAADGMSCVFSPGSVVGSCVVQCSADADLGTGVKTILGELPVNLLAGEAATISLSGVAVDKAPPAA